MVKFKSVYICQNCEYETSKWVGQCPNCGEWNTMVETAYSKSSTSRNKNASGLGRSSSAKFRSATQTKLTPLSQVSLDKTKRLSSSLKEFDRVLGGGFVPGHVVLLAGDPGIGKSTLLTQISSRMKNSKVLYVCGEESAAQIRIRSERMGYSGENLYMLPENNVDEICQILESRDDIALAIIDSIQTLYSEDLTGMAGSVGQVRGSAQKLTDTAKKTGMPVILVGHVTKEGTVAGPKVLEHIVDTVLYLEGDSQHLFRVLKTTKNRFGPISEAGIFEMQEAGMREVENPSELFLSQKVEAAVGSCVTVVMEGFRPILFEIQALTLITKFGNPRRTASGFSVNRLQVLLAIIEKSLNLNLSSYDVYLNVAGGLKVNEYAADLAVCLAVISSVKNKPLPSNVAAFGECGLLGEIRGVSYQQKREKEAQKLGYAKVINPQNSKTLGQAISQVFSRKT
ncbi:DNA repair protein RadA [candidate division WWE3 bacterium RIFCSPHIGHO2_12_FULL_38_15]|uniref:DNA repair protein RadA n=1 Tax=candidate division WWE3 bacterium RIFCSPHIGHO2_02_FULL_38_14 TaxID=1802620 RepID=A0A1F4VAJ8_UNCKA|nr:MAG: DNA repair protein RadA [candidate division WWE3 bacterium RIFCSPHIGHO2_01_FULL_38_45]OGC49573.1 MAG: DNA repair protein RadA [candidate division WWE3 bacterium RIFCSPHIGHO2_12_FULL_38_15]OGC53375.1 MAG: DNA repair protein RadA [candidate division WWE3 bacterium RIFCSPLOWO2_01_FULL_37_24]OGC54235.1 MAG: DNA repair protein RadA [candidate division WWE3 bacterium RIFCSPHIGHO2_02_FULL_38_14]